MVKEKAGQPRRPVFKQRNKLTRFEIGSNVIVQQVRQPQTVSDRADGKLYVVDNQTAFDRGMQNFAVLFKIPSKDCPIRQAIADAIMMTQIARCLGPRVTVPNNRVRRPPKTVPRP